MSRLHISFPEQVIYRIIFGRAMKKNDTKAMVRRNEKISAEENILRIKAKGSNFLLLIKMLSANFLIIRTTNLIKLMIQDIIKLAILGKPQTTSSKILLQSHSR